MDVVDGVGEFAGVVVFDEAPAGAGAEGGADVATIAADHAVGVGRLYLVVLTLAQVTVSPRRLWTLPRYGFARRRVAQIRKWSAES
jgi:hypothetical protein